MQNFHFAIASPQVIDCQKNIAGGKLFKLFAGGCICRDRGGLTRHLINRHHHIDAAGTISPDILT